MPLPFLPALWPRLGTLAVALAGTLAVSACTGFGGGPTPSAGTGLAPGLVAAMDSPGARLDRDAAFSLLNQYRATRGTPAFVVDPALSAQAETLARAYAGSGTPPTAPAGTQAQFSAGYTTFADTFSGWRGNAREAGVLASGQRAGLAVAYDPDTTYGTYWVLLIGA